MANHSNKVERKKQMTRIVCLAICGVMIVSVVLAALLGAQW